VIDLCPVGALTSREYRFQSRPWDLVRHTDSVCPLCSNGCNVILDVRHRQTGEELLRIRPRGEPGGQPLVDVRRGRFRVRLPPRPGSLAGGPTARGQGHVEAPLDDLLAHVAEEIRRIVRAHGEGAIGCIMSSRHTTEEMFLARCFFRDVLRTPHLDHRVRPVQWEAVDAPEDGLLRRTDKTANGRGARGHRPLARAGRTGHAGHDRGGAGGRAQGPGGPGRDLVRDLPDLAVREALGKLELLAVTASFPTRPPPWPTP